MRARDALAMAWSLTAAAASAHAADVFADPPADLAVTIYRAPYRDAGSINLNALNGFALVTETRTIRLPAGETRLRFPGVADGIEPASAILTGLPSGVIEKNRDAKLLSPSALMAATAGGKVELVRTLPKTGKTERSVGTLLVGAGEGVLFKTEQGVEALRCSGLPETFSFDPIDDLSALPTLSVLVRNPRPVAATVTLSYLARGFDWAADYTATLSADTNTMTLGAWVTLANGNGVGFPAAHAQVVAGRLNRESAGVDPLDMGGRILAQCWPRGSTSDSPALLQITRAYPVGAKKHNLANADAFMPMAAMALRENSPPPKVQQEQLGDLKLYRIPARTTVASRQSKQVRLMDRENIPMNTLYEADVSVMAANTSMLATRLLRTRNDSAHHLGLPLPSGSAAIFSVHDGERLLEHESNMRDLAIGEEVEINMGPSQDVNVSTIKESTAIDPADANFPPLVPGVVSLRSAKVASVNRVEITNAGARSIRCELHLYVPEGARVVRADQPLSTKNGRPMFDLTVPANGAAVVRYQTQADSSVMRR